MFLCTVRRLIMIVTDMIVCLFVCLWTRLLQEAVVRFRWNLVPYDVVRNVQFPVHWFLCALLFQADPGLQCRQSSLSWALFFICSYSTSLLFIQSIIASLSLPRVLDPSILSFKTVRRRHSLLNTWPNQFFCLCQTVFIELLFSSTMSIDRNARDWRFQKRQVKIVMQYTGAAAAAASGVTEAADATAQTYMSRE